VLRGFTSFPSKVTQIIQYEAQQNIPFPLTEVVWDFQILGTTPTGELEVLLVAIKTGIVEGLFGIAEDLGMRVQLVDVGPAALCNAFRYNYGDLEGCTMLLDIGAKSSNLIFFEKGKIFARSINIGANAITQDFATESKMPFVKAEQFKITEGFVSLGGAYEEPENPQQAQISKIARQVMTRLHLQINQTMQFYRGQQGGSAPNRLFLAGMATLMPYTSEFFSEKLNNIEVDYFNPLRNVDIAPGVDLESLAPVTHAMGQVIGLGLRSVVKCPVELNLMPKSALSRQAFNQKKPFFVAAVVLLSMVILALGGFYSKVAAEKNIAIGKLTDLMQPLKSEESRLKGVLNKVETAKNDADSIADWSSDRLIWHDIFSEIHRVITMTEQKVQKNGSLAVEPNIWIEHLSDEEPSLASLATLNDAGAASPSSMMDPTMAARYGLAMPAPGGAMAGSDAAMADPYGTGAGADPYGMGMGMADPYGMGAAGGAGAPAAGSGGSGGTILYVTCTAVDLSEVVSRPGFTRELAFALQDEFKASEMFNEEGTVLDGNIERLNDVELPKFRFSFKLQLEQSLTD